MKTLRDYINVVEALLNEAPPVDPRSQAERDSQMANVKAAYKDSQDAEQGAQPTNPATAQPAAGTGQKGPTVAAAQGQDPSNPLNNQATAQSAPREPGDLGSAEEWKAAGYNNLVKSDSTAQSAQPAPQAAPKQSVSKAVSDIAKASGIADPNKIKVGQKIKLPNGGEYTVAAGDTLGAIAAGKYKGTAPTTQAAQPAAAPATPKTADELRGFDPAETKKITDLQAQIAAEKDPTKKSQLNQELVKLAQQVSANVSTRAQTNAQTAAQQQIATAGTNAAAVRAADNAMAAANTAPATQSTTTVASTGVNTGVAKPAVVAQPAAAPTAQSAQPANPELDNVLKNAGLPPQEIAAIKQRIQAARQRMAVKVPGGPVITQQPTNDF